MFSGLDVPVVGTALADRWSVRAGERLASSGRHAGAARSAAIEVLACEAQCLIDAKRVIDVLRERHMGSPATVYRVLQELFALRLVRRLDGHDGVARYEIADPDEHHHHFIDERTGAIHPFLDGPLERALVDAADRLGLQLTSYEVIFHGRRRIDGRQPSV